MGLSMITEDTAELALLIAAGLVLAFTVPGSVWAGLLALL